MADDDAEPTRSVDPASRPGVDGPEPTTDERAAAILRDAEAAAAAQGRAMVNEARAVRQRMLDDLERRRQSLLAELRRVRSTLDEFAAGLEEPFAATAGTEGAPPRPAPADPAPEADDAFARLREARAHPPEPRPAPRRGSRRPEPPSPPPERPTSVAEPEVAAVPEPAPGGDDASRRQRDEMLAPLTTGLLRGAKRLLQDEHNELLDAVRRVRVRGRVDVARLLPDPEKQHAAWSAVLAPTIDEAYTVGRAMTGRRRRPASAPKRLVAELAAGLITPLRERLTMTVDGVVADGPYETTGELHAALGPAISARYREWRARDLDGLLGDLLAAAYARGAFDATPSGALLRWVPAEVGQCPDADDNALEPTVKGRPFPTGQPYPPAHPGCRCLVVPSDVRRTGPHV
jgi:hypothetical protein